VVLLASSYTLQTAVTTLVQMCLPPLIACLLDRRIDNASYNLRVKTSRFNLWVKKFNNWQSNDPVVQTLLVIDRMS
jgi:hypothetical protein